MQRALVRLLVRGLHRTGKSCMMKGRLQAVEKQLVSCLWRVKKKGRWMGRLPAVKNLLGS